MTARVPPKGSMGLGLRNILVPVHTCADLWQGGPGASSGAERLQVGFPGGPRHAPTELQIISKIKATCKILLEDSSVPKCWLSKIKAKAQALQTACKRAGSPPVPHPSPPQAPSAELGMERAGLGSEGVGQSARETWPAVCAQLRPQPALCSQHFLFLLLLLLLLRASLGTWPKPCFPRTLTQSPGLGMLQVPPRCQPTVSGYSVAS